MALLPNSSVPQMLQQISAQLFWLWPRRNLYTTEVALLPDPNYLQRHSREVEPDLYLQPSMRAIAISWLVEVALEFEMHQETLFLATHLFDRYLSQTRVRHQWAVCRGAGPRGCCWGAAHAGPGVEEMACAGEEHVC